VFYNITLAYSAPPPPLSKFLIFLIEGSSLMGTIRAPSQRPPVALRYAIWTLACSITEKYKDLKDLFYQRARKYVEADAIKGYGEHSITIAHCQTHILLASFEFKMMYFPRAWMNTGAAVRLAQM
jgi:hypothetical protein